MFTIFEEVKNGIYVKTKVGDDGNAPSAAGKLATPGKGSRGVGKMAGDVGSPRTGQKPNVVSKATIVENSAFLKCVDIPVVTPNGDVLIHSPGLNFTVLTQIPLL